MAVQHLPPLNNISISRASGANPYNYNTASSRWAAPTLATGGGSQSPSTQEPAPAHQPVGPSPSRDQDSATSTYTIALKVLNPQNKKDYTMFTLRDLTEEDLSSPNSIKEAIFVQVGEDIVSRKLDFQVGFTIKSHKMWINNDRDIHDVLEILKTRKFTLWCIGVGPNAAKKCTHAREDDSESNTSDTEVSKGNASHSTKKKKTASEERESRVVELKKKQRQEKRG